MTTEDAFPDVETHAAKRDLFDLTAIEVKVGQEARRKNGVTFYEQVFKGRQGAPRDTQEKELPVNTQQGKRSRDTLQACL